MLPFALLLSKRISRRKNMVGKQEAALILPPMTWQMPIAPDAYDRSSLTKEEYDALEQSIHLSHQQSSTHKARSLRAILARLDQPIIDVHFQRHRDACTGHSSAKCLIRKEMYTRQKAYWDWSLDEWLETLCPTTDLFFARHQRQSYVRTTIIDVAYFLGQVSDLRTI